MCSGQFRSPGTTIAFFSQSQDLNASLNASLYRIARFSLFHLHGFLSLYHIEGILPRYEFRSSHAPLAVTLGHLFHHCRRRLSPVLKFDFQLCSRLMVHVGTPSALSLHPAFGTLPNLPYLQLLFSALILKVHTC